MEKSQNILWGSSSTPGPRNDHFWKEKKKKKHHYFFVPKETWMPVTQVLISTVKKYCRLQLLFGWKQKNHTEDNFMCILMIFFSRIRKYNYNQTQ